MYQLSIIRDSKECPWLDCRVQMANCQVLIGLCWSSRKSDLLEYIQNKQYYGWILPGESMVIHNQSTGKMYPVNL